MSSARPNPWPARLMATLTLLLVVGVAGGGWWLLQQRVEVGTQRRSGSRSQPANPSRVGSEDGGLVGPPLLQPDSDYYAHVKLIELRAAPPDDDDGAWDARGGTPDINFKLLWNGTLLHESPQRDDTLIAEWDLIRVDLLDAIQTRQIDVASAMNAPLINVTENGLLTIEVWDDDVSFSDEAGRFDLPIATLTEGINQFNFEEGGVARLVLDMVPRDLPLPDLLERASNR